jgi:hypothetical protein
MHVALMSGDKVLGTAQWANLPVEGDVMYLRTTDGTTTESRRVEKIEDGPLGGKIVHLGSARPLLLYARSG